MTSRRNVQDARSTRGELLEMQRAQCLEPAAEHTLKETWWPGGRTGHQPERHATGKGLGAGADLQGAVGQGQGA